MLLQKRDFHSTFQELPYFFKHVKAITKLLRQKTWFIQASLCKSQHFSRTSKGLSYCFQGLKTYEKY